MAYLTEFPGAVVVDVNTYVVDIRNTQLLNLRNKSTEIDNFLAVDDSEPNKVYAGEKMGVEIDGDKLYGTYLGAATLQNTAVSVLNLATVHLNPIHGHLFADKYTGKVYFISDAPLSDAHIGLTVTTFLGTSPANLSTVAGIINALPGVDVVQIILDAAILSLIPNPNGVLNLDAPMDLCFCGGTMIRTEAGDRLIEHLKVGDRVLSHGGEFRPVLWIGQTRLSSQKLARRPQLRPIRIRAGALGAGMPERDLFVSPQHRILISSPMTRKVTQSPAVLVAAIKLVGMEGVTVVSSDQPVIYYHLLLDQHAVVLGNGAWSESLYIGPMTVQLVSGAARQELQELFPELFSGGALPKPAVPLVSGKEARRLVQRHLRNRLVPYCGKPPAFAEAAVPRFVAFGAQVGSSDGAARHQGPPVH